MRGRAARAGLIAKMVAMPPHIVARLKQAIASVP